MRNKRILAVSLVMGLILSAYWTPYTWLSQVHAWTGSFLFWVMFVLAAILLNVWITSGWRDSR